MYDVAIIGGGAAGLSAALVLGRARRKVLVCDSGQPRNQPSHAVHGFFTRDGISPAELLHIGREQLAPYPVEIVHSKVTDIIPGQAFSITLEDGRTEQARKILLATGMQDKLPAIPGMADFWGSSVFLCPYCHGWEVRDQPLAVISSGEEGFMFTRTIRNWSADLVLCTNGESGLNAEQLAQLNRLSIRVIETPIQQLTGTDGQLQQLIFEDGTVLDRSALFVRSQFYQHSPLAAQLGCQIDEHGLVKIDEKGFTGIPGVYASGDMATQSQVILAASSGAKAAFMLNFELIFEDQALLVS